MTSGYLPVINWLQWRSAITGRCAYSYPTVGGEMMSRHCHGEGLQRHSSVIKHQTAVCRVVVYIEVKVTQADDCPSLRHTYSPQIINNCLFTGFLTGNKKLPELFSLASFNTFGRKCKSSKKDFKI